jgi:uncharacterized pyridoxamine 5'-phosphate oxidase family protein
VGTSALNENSDTVVATAITTDQEPVFGTLNITEDGDSIWACSNYVKIIVKHIRINNRVNSIRGGN